MAGATPGTPEDASGEWLSVAAALVWPLQAAVIARVFAALLAGEPAQPVLSALVFLLLACLRAGLEALSQARLAVRADARTLALRDEIVASEAGSNAPAGGEAAGAGAIAALASEKVEALRPFILRYGPARRRSAVIPPLILLVALTQSWAVALVLLVAGPLVPVFMALVGRAAREASARQMVEVGQLSDLLADRLAALADLRLIGAGDAAVDGFREASESLRRRTMAVLRVAFLSSTLLEFFSAIGIAMVAVWVGFSLLGSIEWGTWGPPLTPFAGIFLLLVTPDFFQPLRDLAAAWHDRAAAVAVEDELTQWRARDRHDLQGSGRGAVPLEGPAAIALEGVRVRRGDRLIAYPDISIGAGESLAVVGPSGIGKTSLLRLLAGLDRPEHGRVLVAGVPLDAESADRWRARIGWMPQAPHFLNRALRYNVGFGADMRPEVTAAARLGPVIAALPDGALTPLGERGAGLSGGEARRVTLARALNGRPDVLLADEPTADLDSDTADAIADALTAFAGSGGTLVVATHDPRLVARMGRVLDLGAEVSA